MKVDFTRQFHKQYYRLPVKTQRQFDERLELFIVDQTASILRVHPLRGAYSGYWSMNVSGDFRALFYYEDESIVVFALIGTHSQLYG